MRRSLYSLVVAVLSTGVVALAGLVTFGAWSFYVLTSPDPAGMEPGTVRYETREFWLSVDDIRHGRGEWTAELPDIIGRDTP